MKSKAALESEISQAMIRFEKDYMGRGPVETRTYLIDDLVLVRLKKVLTQAEFKLAAGSETPQRRALVKQVRQELLEHGRPLLETAIREILGVGVVSLHTDISTKTGERIIVFTLESTPVFSENSSK
jgi:uncharacterized protein YbcI